MFSVAVSVVSRPRSARLFLWAGAALAIASTAVLTVALVVGDFSLDYVGRTTSLATPWPYRVAALWGAMEGSLLFYSTLSLGFGAFAVSRLGDRFRVGATPMISAVGGGLLVLTALMANPFLVLDIPSVDGEGLVAILQHPAMIYHPPILYLGLTSLLVPFAITIAAVRAHDVDATWIRITRRWILISWTLLTFGMVAGANWAYVELGWGGFWAWDPVENTSLMPWLAVTIFLHTSRIQLRDGRLARWNVLLAVLPFVLTVLGVYLTRSGVTGSVHAFAESDEIGKVLLALFAFLAVAVLWISLRAAKGEAWGDLHPGRRDSWLAAQGGLLSIVLIFVLVGSAYPAYISVFGDSRTSVDPTFFVTLILPITLVLAVGLALAMRTRWNKSGEELRNGWRSLALAAGVSTVIAWVAIGLPAKVGLLLLILAVAAVLVLGSDLVRRRPKGRILAGYMAHMGMALVLVGAGGSSLGAEFRGAMAVGDVVEVGGYQVRLDGVETGEADRFIYVEADIALLKGPSTIDVFKPQIRAYEDQPLPVPEPVLRSSPGADVVVALSRVNQDASGVEVNVFVRPLVFWVWVGGLLIALAGLIGLIGRGGDAEARHRAARAGQPDRAATSAG